MKVIQVPMDEKLLRAMNRNAKATRSSRAAVIRKACEDYLRRQEEDELERQYIEGYRRKAENPVWGRLGKIMAAKVLPREDWKDWDEEG